jgi:predicted GNAT superfamily acetyltransferase
VLALNAAHVTETGPLDQAGLDTLLAEAARATVAEPEAGFLIAFAPTADLDGPNFRWFRQRMDDFLYIDRVVVAPAARGRGVARALYADAAAAARGLGLRSLVAEVGIAPRNPASLAFHERAGFRPMGEAHLNDRGRTVRYLRLDLA